MVSTGTRALDRSWTKIPHIAHGLPDGNKAPMRVEGKAGRVSVRVPRGTPRRVAHVGTKPALLGLPTVSVSLSPSQVCDLVSPTEAMQRFQEYLSKQVESNDAAESPPKRPRCEAAAEEPSLQQSGSAAPECKICYCRGINAVFAGCGHLVCCLVCAYRVDKCPICRVQVRPNEIIRTFTA